MRIRSINLLTYLKGIVDLKISCYKRKKMQIQWPMVCERERVEQVDPATMDAAWSRGWRHFGRDFFRDSMTLMDGKICRVTPLRVLLDEWKPSKSERRTVKKCGEFETMWHAPRMGKEERDLFHQHKERFQDNVPEGLENFLGWSLDEYPCDCVQCSIYTHTEAGKELIACSYLDLGSEAVSSVYGMFHPDYQKHRLGIYTMLAEMQYAQENGFKYYYSGYATLEKSAYDYKKQFRPQEFYVWQSEWHRLIYDQ